MSDRPQSALRRLLPERVRRSYAATFGFVLLLVTACIVLVGAATYVHAGTVLERDVQRQLASNAEIQANQLDEWTDRMGVQMRSLSESAAFQSRDDSRIAVYLWDVVERDDDIAAAYYVDTENDTIVTSAGSAAVSSATSVTTGEGRERFTEVARSSASATDVVVSDPYRPTPNGTPVILFATKVPGSEGGRAVVAVADLASVSERHLHHIDAGRFVVVDDDGTVVMAEDERRILSTDPLATHRFDNESGTTSRTVDGERTEVAYAALDDREWTVTSRMPASEAYALREDVLAGMGLVLLAVVLGVGLVAGTVGRDTVRAVGDLADHARRLTDGDLDEPVVADREDELGDLFEAFDEMRQSLARQIDEAETARTEALSAKAESEALTRHLEQTASAYGSVMRACARGDLTRRVDPDDRSDAMRAVGESFNAMMADVQEQNEQLKTVSHVLSHDLRNPLNVAVGRTELLADEVDSPHVDPLVTALERIDAIIDDAIVLAMHDDVDDPLAVDLRTRAEAAWEHVETPDATLVTPGTDSLAADTDLLAHVFENLYRNAVEHAGADATVRVGPLEAARGFYVEDDGPGIPESEREAVVEPGYTTNRGDGGTGFGLSIVSKVADAHGWDLRVTESESSGARFEFRVESESATEATTSSVTEA
jgi:signal transduction histidine kinase